MDKIYVECLTKCLRCTVNSAYLTHSRSKKFVRHVCKDYMGADEITITNMLDQNYVRFETLPLLGIRALLEKSG